MCTTTFNMDGHDKDIKSTVFTLAGFNSTNIPREKTENNTDDEINNTLDHRDESHLFSTWESLSHLLKNSFGMGMLIMPMAFKNFGLIFGVFGTIIAGFICTHCVHIFVKTSHEVCRRLNISSLGFGETAEKVFANGPKCIRKYASFTRAICDYGMVLTILSVCCLRIIFISKSYQAVVNNSFAVNWDIRYYVAFTLLPCLMIGEIRSLKYLMPLLAVSHFCISITFAITFWYIMNGPLRFSDRPMITGWGQLPLFFSTVMFAVMPVAHSMKKPQRLLGCTGVLNTTMIIVTIFHAMIGFLGYLRYGEDVEASITLNLPKGTILAKVAQIFGGIAVLITFGIKFSMPMDTLWRKVEGYIPKDQHNISQITLRAGCILILGSIAATVPKLDPLFAMIGAVFFSFLGIFVPALIETIFRYPKHLGFANWILIKNGLLMIFAVILFIFGLFVSLNKIIYLYKYIL